MAGKPAFRALAATFDADPLSIGDASTFIASAPRLFARLMAGAMSSGRSTSTHVERKAEPPRSDLELRCVIGWHGAVAEDRNPLS